jgi:hypothetical protein
LLAFSPVGRKRKWMRMIIRAQRKMKHEGGRPKKANNEKTFQDFRKWHGII